MQERTYRMIILVLIIILIGGGIYFNRKQNAQVSVQNEAQKTEAGQILNKGLDNVSVQVRIKEQTAQGEFNDSLYYTSEEWLRITADDVKKAIQKRVDNWVNLTKGTPAQ